MNKKNKTVWQTRFNNETSLIFQNLGSSIDVDKRLYKQDIESSIVHTSMLGKQKIIDKKKANKIIKGLKKLKMK